MVNTMIVMMLLTAFNAAVIAAIAMNFRKRRNELGNAEVNEIYMREFACCFEG